MNSLTPPDAWALHDAVEKLETQSFAMKVAAHLGVPIETLLHMLPQRAQSSVGAAVNKALEQCLTVALKAGRGNFSAVPHTRSHMAAVAVTGAVGGFFGLPGLLIELPVTTTVMLHSIVEIARSQGENLADPASALSCLEVFALGPQGGAKGNVLESAYYTTRAALAQATREAATYIVQKGVSKESAPALISFISRVAARFGLEVSEKVAAELIPIAGAAGGLALNIAFSKHFQRLAEGHFTVRRLERTYGPALIRAEDDRTRSLLALGS